MDTPKDELSAELQTGHERGPRGTSWRDSHRHPVICSEVIARGLVAEISGTTIRRWLTEDAIRPWAQGSWILPRAPTLRPRPPACWTCAPGAIDQSGQVIGPSHRYQVQAWPSSRAQRDDRMGQRRVVLGRLLRRAWAWYRWDARPRRPQRRLAQAAATLRWRLARRVRSWSTRTALDRPRASVVDTTHGTGRR